MKFGRHFDALLEVKNELSVGVGLSCHGGSEVHVGEGAGTRTEVILVPSVCLIDVKSSLSVLRSPANVGPVCQPGNCAPRAVLHHHLVELGLTKPP